MEHRIAEKTPEALQTALSQYLNRLKAQKELTLDAGVIDIWCKLGDRESLLRVDTQQEPFQFFHDDPQHRPALSAIKDGVKAFVGDTTFDKVFKDYYTVIRDAKLQATMQGMSYPLPDNIQEELTHAIASNAWTKPAFDLGAPMPSVARHGLFGETARQAALDKSAPAPEEHADNKYKP